jgi:hypothetical protein
VFSDQLPVSNRPGQINNLPALSISVGRTRNFRVRTHRVPHAIEVAFRHRAEDQTATWLDEIAQDSPHEKIASVRRRR